MSTQYSQLTQPERSRTNLETSKRRVEKRTGLLSSIAAIPACSLRTFPDDGPDPAPLNVGSDNGATVLESSQGSSDVEQGFRIEVLSADGSTWEPRSRCLERARDHEREAESLSLNSPWSKPGKRPVRIIKPGAKRAVIRFPKE